jgi:hypothetical protein
MWSPDRMFLLASRRRKSSSPIVGRVLAGARFAVGALMLFKPEIAEADEQPMRLLVQTIGIRDLVVGTGTLVQMRRDGGADPSWTRMGLTSDLADTVLAVVSFRALGTRAGLIALLAPAPFIAAGRYALRAARSSV